MQIAIFPGSFDPPSYGHLNVIERAAKIFDRLIVVIAVNSQKSYSFTSQERTLMMSDLVSHLTNVEVQTWGKLVVDFAKSVDASVIVRGVRAISDFNYEFELSLLNKGLAPQIETIFIPTDPKYLVLRSSAIKELVRMGGDVSAMVPKQIITMVTDRFKS